MKQFTLNLLENHSRLIIKLENFSKTRILLDTGSEIPVWVTDENALKDFNAVKISSNVNFSGFGGMTSGNLYRIPYFQLGDLIYPQMHIIAKRLNLPCQMLISAPMFDGLIYEIDKVNHKLNVTIPDGRSIVKNVVIYDKDGKMHVICTDGDENSLKNQQ